MKKTILSLALLATAATAANAQATFGVKAGVVAATVAGDDVKDAFGDDVQNRFGFQVGAVANFAFSDLLSFQPELLYSQKGFQIEEGGDELKFRSHYIDVPLLLRLNADGPFFEAGPQLGYLAGQKAEIKTSMGSSSNTDDEGSRKLDIGYVVGLGYQLESGLSAGIRYNGGLTSLGDDDSVMTGDPAKVRNSVFQFQIGYMFGGK